MSGKKWFPLESNPEVMNTYAKNLGLDTSVFCFQDVLSTEDWALEMVPGPVAGVVMLYPISENQEAHRAAEAEKEHAVSENVYYMKQTVGNACGTVGILHSIINGLSDGLVLTPDSFVARMMAETAALGPDERAAWLEGDEEIDAAQEVATAEGQSAQIPLEEQVLTHFICFTCVDGNLYELDGRKKTAINHGPSTPETLLKDSCEVVKQFMARDPEEMRFTILALSKTMD